MEFKLNEMSRLGVATKARTAIKSSDGKGITISLQAELIEAEVTPTPIKEILGVKAVYLYDPEGNRLEFWSGRAKVNQRPDVIFDENRK